MRRLKIQMLPYSLRNSEVRWMSAQIQWVVSPVQIAFWTAMDTHLPNNWFTFAPVSR